MVYAIVTEYTDGRTAVQYVDQKAVPATKTDPCFMGYVDEQNNLLFIVYARAIHPERKHHLVDDEYVCISLDGVESVSTHNSDEIGGDYEAIPIRVFRPDSWITNTRRGTPPRHNKKENT